MNFLKNEHKSDYQSPTTGFPTSFTRGLCPSTPLPLATSTDSELILKSYFDPDVFGCRYKIMLYLF